MLSHHHKVQATQATENSIRIVKYSGYVVQAGMGSAYSGEEKINEVKFGEDGFPTDFEALKSHCPFPIPKEVVEKATKRDAGYLQVEYKWKTSDGQYTYLIRWHTRTPGAPATQGNTWVIERKVHGNSVGQQHSFQMLVGDKWIPRYLWFDAIKARQNGVATPEQDQLLEQGHWPAP